MASQGPNSPATAVDDSTVGTETWSSVTDVLTSNNTYANMPCLVSRITHYVKVTNFGFSIPSGATIDGIVVEVEIKSTGVTGARDSSVKLVKSGTISGTDLARSAAIGAETYIVYGTSTNLWGLAWTDADINSSLFGAAFAATWTFSKGGVIQLDHIRITVYYTASGGGGAVVAKSNFMILETDD